MSVEFRNPTNSELARDSVEAYALGHGATTENLELATTAGIDPWIYGCALGLKVKHDDIMAAHAAGAYIFHYALGIQEGYSHENAIKAAQL